MRAGFRGKRIQNHRGSPAAEAGLKQGHIVLELDSRERLLRVKRGEEILTIKLRLRRLI